jgi:hypothetical protein
VQINNICSQIWLPEGRKELLRVGDLAGPSPLDKEPTTPAVCINARFEVLTAVLKEVPVLRSYNAVHVGAQIPAFRRSLLPFIFRTVQEYPTNLHGVILRTGNIM